MVKYTRVDGGQRSGQCGFVFTLETSKILRDCLDVVYEKTPGHCIYAKVSYCPQRE